MGKEQFEITEEEFKKIAKTEGKVFIQSCNSLINMANVSAIYPSHDADRITEKKSGEIRLTSDGEKWQNYFGNWIVPNDRALNDGGEFQSVYGDRSYYPEIARDCLFTPAEFEAVKHLSRPERLSILIGEFNQNRLENSKPSSMKELISNKTV
jgi:hypothetical protein